jgi:hypothetical protein
VTKFEAKAKLFSAAVSDLYRACRDGDRPGADTALAELAGLLNTDTQSLTHTLRHWVKLPPTRAELESAIQADAQLARDAGTADLVF